MATNRNSQIRFIRFFPFVILIGKQNTEQWTKYGYGVASCLDYTVNILVAMWCQIYNSSNAQFTQNFNWVSQTETTSFICTKFEQRALVLFCFPFICIFIKLKICRKKKPISWAKRTENSYWISFSFNFELNLINIFICLWMEKWSGIGRPDSTSPFIEYMFCALLYPIFFFFVYSVLFLMRPIFSALIVSPFYQRQICMFFSFFFYKVISLPELGFPFFFYLLDALSNFYSIFMNLATNQNASLRCRRKMQSPRKKIIIKNVAVKKSFFGLQIFTTFFFFFCLPW